MTSYQVSASRIIFSIGILFFIWIGPTFWASSYEEGFVTKVATQCLEKSIPWNEGGINSVVASQPTEKEYPRLDVESIRNSIDTALENNGNNLNMVLSEVSNIESKSSQIIEIARIHHREKMNNAFGSAILLARLKIIEEMREALKTKMGSYYSEIENKLNIESQKTQSLLERYGGKSDTSDSKKMVRDRLLQTVMSQHCTYTQYLSYVQKNIQDNYQGMVNLEQSVRQNTAFSGTNMPATIRSARESIATRERTVSLEIERSERNIIKAVDGFMNMEATYGAHILLVMIYDDYLRLRKNLVWFLNPTSQYFEKSYNAQNTNQ